MHHLHQRPACPHNHNHLPGCNSTPGAPAQVLKQTKVNGWGTTEFNAGADVLAQVLELVRQHRVSLPGHICAVVVTTLILEGWSNKLDPHHSVLSQVGLLGCVMWLWMWLLCGC